MTDDPIGPGLLGLGKARRETLAMGRYHLLHANVARARADLEDPVMRGFVERMDEIDALARGSPGFVAQPTLPDEGAVFRGLDLPNVSLWESIDDLRQFTFTGEHSEMLDRRAEWFLRPDRPAYVLCWWPAGEMPTEKEIGRRLAHLHERGPTPMAFTFDRPFTLQEMLEFEEGRP